MRTIKLLATGAAALFVATLAMPASSAELANAQLKDSSGKAVGDADLTQTPAGVLIKLQLKGMKPGEHAFHIHAVGKCEPPFTSAGGHWNPTNMQHGNQNPQGPHFGDMMNITVGPDSTAIVNESTPGGTLHGTNPLLDADGAAVVVHAGLDDYKSDPAGNAGGRVACGVVMAK